MVDMMVADLGSRRGVARADAWRPHDAHPGEVRRLHLGDQLLGARQHAAQAIADADGDRGRTLLAVGHHVEVGVEGRNLVDLGHRDAQFLRQRMQMSRRQAALAILDEMQIFD